MNNALSTETEMKFISENEIA